MLLPRSKITRTLIAEAAKNGATVAELEYLGVPNRVINTLEECDYEIVYLADLIELTEGEIGEIRQINEVGVRKIKEALAKYASLESEKRRWSHGSERLDFYHTGAKRLLKTILT